MLSTVRTGPGTLLVFLQTSITEYLTTAVDLLWISGHTQADQAEKVIRRWLHKLVIIAFQISTTGCHDVLSLNKTGECLSHLMHYIINFQMGEKQSSSLQSTLKIGFLYNSYCITYDLCGESNLSVIIYLVWHNYIQQLWGWSRETPKSRPLTNECPKLAEGRSIIARKCEV